MTHLLGDHARIAETDTSMMGFTDVMMQVVRQTGHHVTYKVYVGTAQRREH